jgi:hypothetical protein
MIGAGRIDYAGSWHRVMKSSALLRTPGKRFLYALTLKLQPKLNGRREGDGNQHSDGHHQPQESKLSSPKRHIRFSWPHQNSL